MITAVSQTLAEILAGGSSLIGTKQIDFDHPRVERCRGPRLNLYCYDLRENKLMQHSGQHREATPNDNGLTFWFDISFLVTAWDFTALGEQRLLSEALVLLLRHRSLPEEILAPELQGHGTLPLRVFASGLMYTAVFWSALGIPMRPALYVTVTVPLDLQGEPTIPEKKMLLTHPIK